MNWKIFITVCSSSALISFPQNIIGCGPSADPYDYYTSFFHQNLPDAKNYRPFYYTGYNFLYDDNEPVETADVLAKEWAAYCGSTVTATDAKKFVNKFAWKDLSNLYFNIEKNQPLKIPDSVNQNSMTAYFLRQKKLETLGYIMYAKKAEPFVQGTADYWESPVRDSVKMDKLIKNGFQLFTAAKEDFIKLRYIYQVIRLAHYSKRYTDVLEWYDKYVVYPESVSILKTMCLALKAGALFRTGNNKEAAYLFSKIFISTDVKRISNFLGFTWSVKRGEDRNNYLSLCRNDTEKAGMLAIFAMNSTADETPAMKEIYRLNSGGSDELEVLAVREINKLEEKYFTPLLQKEKGGRALFYLWSDPVTDSAVTENSKQARELMNFLHEVGSKNNLKNAGLFETGAAYIGYMLKDYTTAKKYLSVAKRINLTPKVKDQFALTNLLIKINENVKIDANFEEEILPSIQWLEEKALLEKPVKAGYNEIRQWQAVYRNLMSEILANRYHQQGNLDKEALCIGAADQIMKGKEEYYVSGSGIDFLRTKLESKDVETLYALMDNRQAGNFETYLISHNSIKKSDVADFAGTAYLRDHNYSKAIEWLKKSADKKPVAKNPFIDLLYDQEEKLKTEKTSITKLAFCTEMDRLQKTALSDKANTAKNYYKYALGLYNITYYGHAWELVKYYRSGSDGYFIPANANAFEKEYYGCNQAQEYFEKAMNATADKNFKARCLFMIAKCVQKQLHRPQYEEYTSDYDKMDAAEKKYFRDFKDNKYFPQFIKEYSNTPFYKEAFTSCSYLRDFVKRK